MKKPNGAAAEAKAPARGRPRSFDCDAALERAMQVFWRHGYEASSVSDLTRAMGINPPSLYAAFGDKQHLYLAAIERYEQGRRAVVARLLDEAPSARQAIERLLASAAGELTNAECRGCMLSTAQCADEALQSNLAERRAAPKRALKARFERALREGELARGTDTGALADFYTVVFQGMALQARDGATRKSLLATAQAAMRAWPPRKRTTPTRKS
jgi:AcrR family transcriptional regulator